MKISILTNNKSCPNFAEEHGLSIYINHPTYNILFDVGYTDVYLTNAKLLGIDLNRVNYIVLSHGHYDHTGGLRYFNTTNSLKNIFIHEDAFIPKYKTVSAESYNGIPFKEDELIHLKGLFKKTKRFAKIQEDIYLISDIKNESLDSRYQVNNRIDDFHDEQVLVIKQDDGLSVFMGCSHFGVVNGIKAVLNRFPGKRIKNLVAGMHLDSKTSEEILTIAKAFDALGVQNIYPLHCTGDLAIKIFKAYFLHRCILLCAGQQTDI